MNRSQAHGYESDGRGIRWLVLMLAKPPRVWEPAKPTEHPRRGTDPMIRTDYAKAMWKVICETERPITKAAWIHRASIPPGYQRTLAGGCINNLVHGGWVSKTPTGRFRRAQ